MIDHETLVQKARQALVTKYGSMWEAAAAMRLELSGGQLLLAMRQQPVPESVAFQVKQHVGIDLNAQEA